MNSIIRTLLVSAAMSVGATSVFAAASNMPTQYQPDPALKTESVSQLRARVSQACAITQARLQSGVSEASLNRSCDCYAGRTMRSLSADELQGYRDTGVFNETARAKALSALDACKLQRPKL
ncbi:hypothetical protein [Microvirga lotononidis]|uniref:UrcA family protein n=1 Tax=Microvirga lotononidis TaxID=864069 RepID=I4YWY7_9HYPH|nr:hypothetical protein [Microvirga lotononidis]EIM28479.1 hypothetical protein MicloDRAFT_00050650 [Microvirga lotononidis]WQO27447.1 hypothetical protein U0023_22875 [Microvirga lotononidis]